MLLAPCFKPCLQELVELSLSAPGRVTLPRAPPHTLLLSGSLFSPFPTGWGLETPLVAKWTGDRLRMRDAAQGELQEFRQQVGDAWCLLLLSAGL
jgi:tRNA pseudouridine38-40 synthase